MLWVWKQEDPGAYWLASLVSMVSSGFSESSVKKKIIIRWKSYWRWHLDINLCCPYALYGWAHLHPSTLSLSFPPPSSFSFYLSKNKSKTKIQQKIVNQNIPLLLRVHWWCSTQPIPNKVHGVVVASDRAPEFFFPILMSQNLSHWVGLTRFQWLLMEAAFMLFSERKLPPGHSTQL